MTNPVDSVEATYPQRRWWKNVLVPWVVLGVGLVFGGVVPVLVHRS